MHSIHYTTELPLLPFFFILVKYFNWLCNIPVVILRAISTNIANYFYTLDIKMKLDMPQKAEAEILPVPGQLGLHNKALFRQTQKWITEIGLRIHTQRKQSSRTQLARAHLNDEDSHTFSKILVILILINRGCVKILGMVSDYSSLDVRKKRTMLHRKPAFLCSLPSVQCIPVNVFSVVTRKPQALSRWLFSLKLSES